MILKYIKNLFKQRLAIFIVLFVSMAVIFLLTNRGDAIIYKHYNGEVVPGNTIFTVYTVCLCIAATATPIGELSFKMKRISSEQMYALPIKRDHLFYIRALFSYLEIIIPFTLAYLVSVTFILVSKNLFIPIYFLYYYLLAIVGAFFINSIVSFFYTQANNMLDGILFVAGAIFLGSVVMMLVELILKTDIECSYNIYKGMDYLTCWMNKLVIGEKYDPTSSFLFSDSVEGAISTSIYLGAFGTISTVLYVIFSKRVNAEDVSRKSESYFGYRVLIPLYGIVLSSVSEEIIIIAICLINVYLLYALFRRNFNLKKRYWIEYGIVIAVSLLLNIITR